MNALCYKTVFSKRLGALVAVGEHATSQSKGQGAGVGSGAGAWGLGSVLRYVGVLALGFAWVSLAWSQSLPQGGRVAEGKITISHSGQHMAITQSTDKAVVNWDNFDIGANAKVSIAQPGTQSVLLNRVLSDNPTQILGQLQANGQVVLVNPKGIVVGSDGSVSASAFTASTLNISDADFMAGHGRYTREGSTGEVVNKGRISVAPGGYVALLGARVSNEGQIIAPQGGVALGAAETVSVPIGRTGKIKLELSPASINASVANQKGGLIVAEGGQVYMQAAALGQAVASALHSGHIDTSGEQAGAVHVLADGGQIKVDGSITANSSSQDDQGQRRKGGDIFIGRDEETGVLARFTNVSGAKLESQRGFVETSGDHLVTTGTRVKAGEWLLDPTNITIGTSASGTTYTDPNATGGSYTYTAGATSLVRASDIQASLNDGTSVTIATSSSGTDAGNINVNTSIAKTGGSAASLTLRAHNDIVVAANTTITSTSGNLTVTLNSDFDASGAGAIAMNTGSGITSNGGNITFGGGSAGSGASFATGSSSAVNGVLLDGATVNAGGGNIVMRGQGAASSGGINLKGNAAVTTSGTGTVQLTGQITSGVFGKGISVTGGASVNSALGDVTMTGTGGSTGNEAYGVELLTGGKVTTSGGNVTVTASSQSSGNYGYGMRIDGTGSQISTGGSGSVTINANGSATGATDSLGINIRSVEAVKTSNGNISITGTSRGTAGNINIGIGFNSGTVSAGGTGTVTLTGTGGSVGTHGIGVSSARVVTAGGAVNITGTSTSTGTGTSDIEAASGNISTSGGNVTFTGNSYVDSGTGVTINAGAGTVTLQNRTAGTLIDVGGTSADVLTAPLKLGISSTELGRISAGTVVVGRNDATASGNVVVNATNMGAMGNSSANLTVQGNDISVSGNVSKTAGTDATLTLRARGDISVATNTTITATSGKLNVVLNSDRDGNNNGGIVMNTGSGITSNGGDIRFTGGPLEDNPWYWAYGTALSPSGITFTGTQINAGGGNINLRGASVTGDHLAHGVSITGGSISTTGAGYIDIQGLTTGRNTNSSGIAVLGATITGGSTGQTRLIGTNTSTGTNGRNQGVWLNNADGVSSLVTSSGGNVTVTGQGGGGSASTFNYGVTIENGLISSGGTGTINVTGTGGTSTGTSNAGVAINGTAASPIGISSNGGIINVTGVAGSGSSSQGIWFVTGRNGSIHSGNNAAINLTTDSLVMESGTINAGSGIVTIQNRSAGTLIDVGGTSADVLTAPLKLGVSSDELGRISAGTVVVGRNDATASGNVVVNATNMGAMGNSSANLTVLSGGNLTVSGAVTKTAGNDATLTLDAANGIDINADVGATAGQLNVNVTARGLQAGTSSRGLFVNKVINANGGAVTLRGTTSNTNGNSRGVSFSNGSGITAASFDVLGISTGNGSGNYGVFISGTTSFNSTLDSIINGTSLAQTTALTFGTTIDNAANVHFNAGTSGGKLIVKGSNAAWQTGLRIGAGADGATPTRLTTDGDVTLGALEANSNLSFRSGNITANSGHLTLLGQNAGTALSSYEGTAITANNGASLSMEGISTATNGTGVLLGDYSGVAITTNGGGSVTVKGTTAGGTAVQLKNNTSINASGAVSITGTSTGNAGTIVGVLTSSTSTIQGTSVSIKGDAKLGNGINLDSAVTATNAGTISLEGTTTSTAAGIYGVKTGTTGTLTATGGTIHITADTLDIGSSVSTGTTGAVNIAASSTYATFGGLDSTGTAGAEGLGLSTAEIDRITTAKLLVESTAGNVKVDTAVTSAATTGDVHLKAANSIELNNALTIGGADASKNLTLQANGATGTVTQTAAIKAAGLELQGSQATHTLTHSGNDVQTVAGNTQSVSYFDSNALTVGTVNATSGLTTTGTIQVESNASVAITQAISTSDAKATAVTINAGKSTNAGTATGGDISFSGSGGVSVGSGGRATLFTGSVAGSTGLGIVEGNNRFNSDELTTGYTTALDSGTYAIYREAPTLSVRFNDSSKTYNGQAFTGGAGVTVLSGLVGNDTSAVLGTVSYSGTAQNAVHAGSYAISGTTAAASDLGYSLAYTSGTLTVNKANLSATGSKIYDATTAFSGSSFSSITGVNGETFTATGSGTLASPNVQSAQTLQSLGDLSLVGVNGALASNYNWSTASTSVSVTPRTLTVTGANNTVTYNGSAQTNSGATISGNQGSDTFSISGYGSGTHASTTAYADNLLVTGTGSTSLSNYSISYNQGGLTIGKAALTVTGNSLSTTYNGQNQTIDGFTVSGLLGSDQVSDLSGISASGATALNVGSVANTVTVVDQTNYTVSGVAGALNIAKANLSATGSKIYDASTAFSGSSFSSITGVNGETFTATGSGTLASQNVQSAQALQSLGDLSLVGVNGALASNYNWSTASTSVSVTPRTLTVTGANNTVTYNGSAQTNSGATISGNQGSDSFTISGYGSGTHASTTAYADNLLVTGTGSTSLSNYSISYNQGGLTIGKANLSATGSKVYDASTAFAGSSFSSITGVNGETFTATGSGTLTSQNVQSAQALQSLGDLSLVGVNGALASNYNWTTASTSVSVSPRTLIVTGANNTVTYNGSAQTNTGATISGNQGSDSFIISGYGSGTNASATAYADNLSVAAADGTLLSNYSIGYTHGGLTIDKAPLTVTGANNTVTYNGSVQTNTGATISGTQGSDTFSISGFASGTNAGNYTNSLSVTGTGGTLLSNYEIGYTHGSLTIDKANLTLSGTRVYDATTTFAGQYLTASGVAGQTFSVTGSGDATNLTSKNVQTSQALNSVTGLSLGSSSNGGLTSNYNALTATGSSVSVTPKALTASATAADKTYDATALATVSGTTSADILGSDNVVIGHTTASFADANVARDGAGQVIAKSVSVSGLSLSGTDALNYSLQNTSATTSAKINPQAVSLSSLSAAHKVYDGNVNADITGASFSGTINTETLSLTGTAAGSFADKNVGTAKVVSVADVSALTRVNGTGSWNNYQLSTSGGFATSADITPKNVTIASLTASNKTYDGNTNATITSGVITTGVGSETLAVSGTGLFNNKNVGNSKTVTVADVTALTRTDGTGVWSNYNLDQTGALTTTASIAPKAITLSGITGINKVYDGGTAAAASTTNAVFDGKITGDDLTVQSTGVFADKNVGQLKNVTLSHVLGGTDLANYTISTQQSTTASISQKSATVSATSSQLTYNGAVQNQSSETRSGFLAGDTITVAGQASGKNAGTYGSSLVVSGVDAPNYSITVNNANLVIDQAALTVTANAVTKTYDANLNASGTGTVAALAGAGAGDVVNSAGTQAFLDANAGSNKTVRASGVTIKDASNADMTANYTISYVDNTTSVINKAPLTVKANDDARFVGLADSANFAGVQYDGLVGGEPSSVLGGTLLVKRSNVGTGDAGVYPGVLTPDGLTSNNYEIAYASGQFTIVPADQLLIRTTNQNITYGTAPTYVTTAQYLKSDNTTIITLTRTGSGNDYTFSDGLSTSVRAVLQPYVGNTLASTSSTGHTVVGNYDIKDLAPTVIGSNFKGAPVFVGSLSVNTKAVTPNATGVSKVYDGTTAMNNVVVGLTGEVTGDQLSISGTGAFTQKNVGSSLNYTIANITLGGDDAANYHLSGMSNSLSGSNGSITPAPLVLTSANVLKTYDRSTSASGTAVATNGTQLFGSDSLSGGTFVFDNKNAGTNKVVRLSGVTVGDGNSGGNYTVSFVDNTTSTILAKELTASYSAADKTYNGNTLASVTGSSADIIDGDAVSLSHSSANFDNKNVGTNKTVTVSGIALGGADAGNYSLQNTGATASADISAKSLNISYTANHKVYDGLTNASVSGSSSDIVSGDVIGFTQTAHFEDKNVANDKGVSITQIGLNGADAGNYALAFTTASASANITPKDVSLSSITAAHKVYDGNNTASISSGVINTGVSGETLAISGSGTFSDANAANGKTVTVANVTALTKTDGTGNWSNYNLTTTGALTTTANINRKDVTLDSITAASKTYDGSDIASITSGVINTGVGSETLGISGSGTFSDANAADGKTVTVANVTALTKTNGTGNWDNYNLTSTGARTTTANITRKAVTLQSITAADKVYDGSVAAAITSGVVLGTVNNETLSVSGAGLGSFSDKNAGNGKEVSVADVSALTRVNGANGANGGNWNNYQLTTTGELKTTANIIRKDVTLDSITATHKVYDGNITATITAGAISTGVGSETLAISGQGTFSDANAADGKVVTVAQTSSLTQTDGSGSWSNYRLTTTGPISTTANITRKNVSLSSITAAHKVYDGSDAAAITSGVVLGTVGTESLSVSGSGTFSDANAAEGKTVSVADVTALTQANGSGNWNNYNLITTGALTTTGNITRKDVTLDSITATDKVYDGNNAAVITSGTINTGVSGETLAISGSGTFSDANAANNKTVTVANVSTLAKANGTGNWSNYNLTTTGALTTTANITRKNVTLTSITAAHKVYDGSDTASITSGAINTGVGTETLAVSGSGTFSDAHAADGKTVTVANVSTLTKNNGTGDWNNYYLTTTGSMTAQANITRKDVNLDSITAAGKTYDGNNSASITSVTLRSSDFVGSETLSATATGTFDSPNAGSRTATVTAANTTLANGSNGGLASNYNVIGSRSASATIAQKDVNLDSITAAGKTYDGSDSASITSVTLRSSDFVGSETLSATATGTFDSPNAGSRTATVTAANTTLSNGSNGGLASNYKVIGTQTASATIDKKDLNLDSITAAGKTYDGNNSASITSVTLRSSDFVGSETLTATATGTFDSPNAGSRTATVTAANTTLANGTNGGLASNYNVIGTQTASATIAQKDVNLDSITAASKTYDGSHTATISAVTLRSADFVGSETLTATATGTFDSPNAGSRTATVTAANTTLANGSNGGLASNYKVIGTQTASATIDKKDVNLDSITAAGKTYDGNNSASITSVTLRSSDFVGSETLSATATGTFDSPNAGSRTATVTAANTTLANGSNGGLASNYKVIGTQTASATIAKKDVNLDSINAANKTYDGNNTATITSGTISTGVSGETLAISGSGTFSDANAADGKTVTVANVIALTKTDGTGNWDNYNLTTTGALTTTANITRKDVTLTSITAADKVYDGTAVASITGGSVSGTLIGESLSVSGQGTFADKHVASDKTVTVQDVSTLRQDNGTGDWRNYQLITTGSLTDQADITPKALSVSGITAAAKTYDGNTQATVSTSAVVWDGRVAGDNLTVSSTGAFSDKNAGTAKVVTLTHTLGGTDLGNYTVTTQASTTADITPKALNLVAGPVIKTYDGNLNYSTSAADLTALSAQLISGDTVTAASLAFTDKNAGTGNKNITFNSATLQDGNNGGNYSLTLMGNSNSTIDKAPITAALQGTVAKTYDGLDSASVNSANFATSGWVSGEGASITQTAAVYADKNVSANPGNGVVSASVQLGDYAAQANTDLNNYSLPTSASGAVGLINPAALHIKVNDTKMFVTQDANLAFDQGFSYTGLVNGESAAHALTGGAPGAGDRSYTGSPQFPGVGTLSGVYGLSSTPTALNGNYSVSVTPGNLQVIPADKLLVTISSQSDVYGQRKAPQAGVAANGTVTAQYCLDQSNCNGANLYTLTLSSTNGNTWQGTDNTGNTINLGTGLAGTPTYSSGGYLTAVNHTYALSSLSSTVANQFNGHEVNGGVLTLTPLQVGLNASDVTKVYDGNNSLASVTLTPSGTLTGDALQATFGSGSFSGKNVGAQGFTLSGLALQGADQANYVLGSAQLSGTGSITPKSITVSGLQAQDKVYDGNTQASVQISGAVFNGIVTGDQLSVTATGQFDTRHVGNAKTVSLTSSFSGADLDNYSITPQASSTANITPAPLVVTASAARKTYDGNTTAPGVGTVGTLVGAAAGDKVAFGGTQAFTDKNAGSGKTVTVTGVRLVDDTNADVSGNYAITYVESQNGTIDRANASIAAQASSTVYNGSTQSQTGLTYSGFVAGDDVRATGLASGRNAGSYASSLSATGAHVGNYNITFNNASLSITKRPASLSALGQSVVYNGQTQSLNGSQGSGFVAGDALNFGGLPSGRNVGQYTSAMTVSGADAANYDVTLGSATLTITPKTASVTARPERVTYNGQTQQPSSALLEGFVAGDDIRVSGLASGRNAGVYGSNLLATGQDVRNYSITYQQGALTIDKAPLQFVGTSAADKVYDGNTEARVTPGSIAGLMGTETLNIDTVQGQFDNAEMGMAKPVQVVYGLSDGANGGLVANYQWSPVTVKANITGDTTRQGPAPEVVRNANTTSRLSYIGFGGLVGVGAATGQLFYAIQPSDTRTCSPMQLEGCICEQPKGQSIEICYPNGVAKQAVQLP